MSRNIIFYISGQLEIRMPNTVFNRTGSIIGKL